MPQINQGLGVDDVYLNILPPAPLFQASGSAFSGVGVGYAQWGPKNTPLVAQTPQDLFTLWGPPINVGRDIVQDGALFLNQLPLGGFYGIRVTDGTDAAATGAFNDNSGYASGTATVAVATTAVAGDTVQVVVTPASGTPLNVTYTVTAADVAAGSGANQAQSIATNLTALINSNLAVVGAGAYLSTVQAPIAGVITFKMNTTGVGGNTTTIQCTAVPGGAGHAVITPTTATAMTGGAVAVTGLNLTGKFTGALGNSIKVQLSQGTNYTVAAPTWKVVVFPGNNKPEVFDRIPGTTGTAAWTAIAAAINSGLSGSTPASQWVVASVASSSALPPVGLTESTTLTGGTNGATSLTTAAQLGVDGGVGSRTGVYAARGLGMDAVWLCGNTDSTVWTALASFAASESSCAFGAFPLGTTPSGAVTSKIGAALDTPWMVLSLSWITYYDSYLNLNVQLPPTAVVAGAACRQPSHQSPGNTPIFAVIGNEQTTSISPQPYAFTDMAALEANGIMFTANPIPSARLLGLRHGKNCSSNFATSEIAYTRKTNDLVRTLSSSTVLGQFVNKLQGTTDPDPIRTSVVAAVRGYLGPQIPGIINAYDVRCDLTNNPVANIRAGQLQCDIIVQYLSVIDRFIVNITAGQTVSIVSAGPTTQN
jgi:hypothetical protein